MQKYNNRRYQVIALNPVGNEGFKLEAFCEMKVLGVSILNPSKGAKLTSLYIANFMLIGMLGAPIPAEFFTQSDFKTFDELNVALESSNAPMLRRSQMQEGYLSVGSRVTATIDGKCDAIGLWVEMIDFDKPSFEVTVLESENGHIATIRENTLCGQVDRWNLRSPDKAILTAALQSAISGLGNVRNGVI